MGYYNDNLSKLMYFKRLKQIFIIGFLLLCGCGNRGDLYLPDEDKPDKTATSVESEK